MTQVVLDASAVIALLTGEPGGGQVAVAFGDCAISTVNLAEVVAYFVRLGAAAADTRAMLDGLTMERVPFDETMAYDTAALLPQTRGAGLSFGDRACLALARQRGAAAVTADRAWERIAEAVGVEVRLIR